MPFTRLVYHSFPFGRLPLAQTFNLLFFLHLKKHFLDHHPANSRASTLNIGYEKLTLLTVNGLYNYCCFCSPCRFYTPCPFFKLLISRQYRAEESVKIYHWVIMPTHFHLLVEMEEPLLISNLMSGLTHAYTIYHHKKYLTRGFLWQGKFKLQPVQKEGYLIACGRYIERNPVRAALVERVGEYLYSSARFY